MIPKSLRISCPGRSPSITKVTEKYRFELLVATKNDAKHRFFKCIKIAKTIEEELYAILNPEDMDTIKRVTEKSRESMFLRSRERLVKKFSILNKERTPVVNLIRSRLA